MHSRKNTAKARPSWMPWPTVAALTATRAKLHGLLLQDAAAVEKQRELSPLDAARWLKSAGVCPKCIGRMIGHDVIEKLEKRNGRATA